MARLRLETHILAPQASCFDLSLDLDFHMRSMYQTVERAISGKMSGRLALGEEVTWEARHFGLTHRHTTRIASFHRPQYFRDEMVHGRFKHFRHDHYFDPTSHGTKMIDEVDYSLPFGILGQIFDRLILQRYLRRLLDQRNELLKDEAERGSTHGTKPD